MTVDLSWELDVALAVSEALERTIGACGLEDCGHCKRVGQALADIRFRTARVELGLEAQPIPPRFKRFYTGRTQRRATAFSASDSEQLRPGSSQLGVENGVAPRSTVLPDRQPDSASGVSGPGAPHFLTWPPGVYDEPCHPQCVDDEGRMLACIVTGDLQT